MKTLKLRQIFTLIFASLMFWFGTTLTHSLQAKATPLTPEASSYQINSENSPGHITSPSAFQANTRRDSDRATENSKELIDNSQNQLKGIADNVREKLNLDEPIAPSTKEFIHDVQDKIDSIIPGE